MLNDSKAKAMLELPEQRIVGGISVGEALAVFHESVNQAETIFSRDHWLMPKFERLRRLLSDPITADQAGALLDVLYGRRWMADLIEWLEEAPVVPWPDFFEWRRRRNMDRAVEANPRRGICIEVDGHKTNRCPRCSSPDFVPILYGLPSKEGLEAANRGEVVFGGCSIQIDGPQWFCPRCSLEWRWRSGGNN
jgi:hypothetical protein